MEDTRKQRVQFTRQQYEWLDKMFPEHVGNADTTDAEYRYRSGQRAVVLRIKDHVVYNPQE